MDGHDGQAGRGALVVLVCVLIGGGVLIQLTDHLLHLGSVVGNISYVVLVLVTVAAAVSGLDAADRHDR